MVQGFGFSMKIRGFTGTRGKRMVEMIIIMLMTRTSLVRSEARRRRLIEGLL
jgi:hypothetical protein